MRGDAKALLEMRTAPQVYIERMQWQQRRTNKIDKMELRALELERLVLPIYC